MVVLGTNSIVWTEHTVVKKITIESFMLDWYSPHTAWKTSSVVVQQEINNEWMVQNYTKSSWY